MHKEAFDTLRLNTFLLQFYGYLARGFFSEDKTHNIVNLINQNIDRLNLMTSASAWNNNYALNHTLIEATITCISEAKANIKYKQICTDWDIANYIITHQRFTEEGIQLFDLRKLLDVNVLFKNGYMLHNFFQGYPEAGLYHFSINSIDYLHSAAFFYNEGFEYLKGRKDVKLYNQQDLSKFGPFELRRIQSREEIMLRSFRESYINLILFIESFINSVGYDAYLMGLAADSQEELFLKGITTRTKSGYFKYSNLRDKIKNIANVIGKVEIDLETEPFKSYLLNDVELRNQFVHSSSDRSPINLGFEEWKVKCDTLINNGFSVIDFFWRKCYPNKVFPIVIFNTYWSSFKGIQGRAIPEHQS